MSNNVQHKEEIVSLTSLRFFAAFYILLYHVYGLSLNDIDVTARLPTWRVFHNFLLQGYLAVDFFFVLSGFILAYRYIPEFRNQNFNYKDFLLKRFARLYPVHALMVLFVFILFIIFSFWGLHPASNPRNLSIFLFNLFMLNGLWLTEDFFFNAPSWSISLEFVIYFLFPVIVFLTNLLNARSLVIVIVLCIIIMDHEIHYYFKESVTTLTNIYGLLRISLEFTLGVAVYRVYDVRGLKSDISKYIYMTVISIGYMLCSPVSNTCLVFAFSILIFCCADAKRQGIKTIFDVNLLAYLGKISFSLYMVHYSACLMFLYFVPNLLALDRNIESMLVLCVLTIFMSLVMAIFMYHYVEKPARHWITKKWG